MGFRGVAQLINITLPLIFTNSIQNGCQVVNKIEKYCEPLGEDRTAHCIAQSFDLLAKNGTVTVDKFLNDFVQQYTVDKAAFDIFAVTARKCAKQEVKHDPPSNSELWNLLMCMLIPADQLGNAFGCKFNPL